MDPRKLTRRLPWIGLGLAVVGAIVFFTRYAAVTVRVTTIDEFPAGTTCIVDRWSTSPEVAQVVMIELGGERILTRVVRIEGASLWIEHLGVEGVASGAEASPIDEGLIVGSLVSAFAPDQSDDRIEPTPESPPAGSDDRDG